MPLRPLRSLETSVLSIFRTRTKQKESILSFHVLRMLNKLLKIMTCKKCCFFLTQDWKHAVYCKKLYPYRPDVLLWGHISYVLDFYLLYFFLCEAHISTAVPFYLFSVWDVFCVSFLYSFVPAHWIALCVKTAAQINIPALTKHNW